MGSRSSSPTVSRESMRKFSTEDSKDVQELVKRFGKTGDTDIFDEIHRRFEDFFNNQAQEIGNLFNWVASRQEVYDKIEDLFNEALLNYKSGRVYFVTYATKYVKVKAREQFRRKLAEAVLTKPISEDISESDIIHIQDSVSDVRKQMVLFNAARRCEFTTRQAMVFGALLLGVKMVDIGKELGIKNVSYHKDIVTERLREAICG